MIEELFKNADNLYQIFEPKVPFIEKINNVDWNKVSGEKVGARFDFSV